MMFRRRSSISSFTPLQTARKNISSILHYRKERNGKFVTGFTLVELLIVIAILAVLAAAVVIILNPAELLAQARDSQRISDLKSISNTIDILKTEGSVTLGSSNIVYISIPDTSSTCANITGLPVLPSGWSYRCSPPDSVRKVDGSGWIPLNLSAMNGGSPLPYLPIDPRNTVGSFYQYVASADDYMIKSSLESYKYQPTGSGDGGTSTQYEKGSDMSIAPITTDDNWIKVPGNAAFGTSDFWTMKYEAKCVSAADNTPLTSPSLAWMYYNSSTPCTSGNGRYVASVPGGYPISLISHDTAKTYCQSLGAHLMTNEEYMTLARDVESNGLNWTGGSVGSGALYSGNTGGVTEDLQASNFDDDGYFGTTVTSGINRRTHYLSTGAVIWDLAGSVFEHVMRTMADDKTAFTLPTCTSNPASFYFCEYGNTKTPYVTDYGTIPFSTVGSSDPSWNSDQGVGSMLIDRSGARPPGTVLVRGGGAFNTLESIGIYSVFTNQSATASNDIQIGFRCVR